MTEAWLREAEAVAVAALESQLRCKCDGLDKVALAQLTKCAENVPPLVARVRELDRQNVECRRLLGTWCFVRGQCRECLQTMYLVPGDRCSPTCTLGAALRAT